MRIAFILTFYGHDLNEDYYSVWLCESHNCVQLNSIIAEIDEK